MRSETKIAQRPSPTLAVGGKGANQAVAAALLSAGTARPAARFVCRLGDDAYLGWLQGELQRAGLDTSASVVVPGMSTGAGIVWLDAEGAATSVVLGGANTQGWSLLPPDAASPSSPSGGQAGGEDTAAREAVLLAEHAAAVVAGGSSNTSASSKGSGKGQGGGAGGGSAAAPLRASVLLLQREVPEHVNEAFAAAAAAAGIPVLLDAGGEAKPVSAALLRHVDLLAPNEQELQRLTGGRLPTDTEEQVAAAAGTLMAAGARGVLVTLEGRGSLLLLGEVVEEEGKEKEKGSAGGAGAARRCRPVRAIRQPALPVPGGVVVDATAAGDAFRAALAVALVEGQGLEQGGGREGQAQGMWERALRFAAAAGAIAVSRMGAMPSLPTRVEVEQLLAEHGDSPAAQAWDAPELLAAAARAAATGGALLPSGESSDREASSSPAAAAGSCSVGDGNSTGVREGTCSNPRTSAPPTAEASISGSCSAAPTVTTTTPSPEQQPHLHDEADEAADGACPLLFGARLNSQKSRRDTLLANYANYLVFTNSSTSSGIGNGGGGGTADNKSAAAARNDRLLALLKDNGPLGWVARQGLVRGAGPSRLGQHHPAAGAGAGGGGGGGGGSPKGLDVVYFNYPEHLKGLTLQQVQEALSLAGLAAGGVAMRFPADPFRTGALTNPDPALRAAAVALAVEGCGWAAQLAGVNTSAASTASSAAPAAAGHLVVWSAYDGYDYHLQADYGAAWSAAVEAYGRLADACAALGVAVSIEPKPTDPSSRFSFLPNTASALALVSAVGRPNLGLTLDAGHMLMAGECMAQSVQQVAAAGRLFGLHLNDGHGRLGAEDGLVFGSVHGSAALELVYWLRYKLPAQPAGAFSRGGAANGGGAGLPHAFFDTFPLNEDPVLEAAANVRAFRDMWARAGQLRRARLDGCLAAHDALCSMQLMAMHL
ncbi:hypothetical protein HYH02_001633 [Chlamydomonas schloesseri]|uniref:Ribokinase n=1 Tax=Chlamydomonas schloesseri TaxID=2026947 RepID=A0A836BC03_9CHLO|nr:hypothetical protein HYH02_001633 [Chlamydomonas schloesseri]|eukprot:KAG2453410.1 hypothetical protein HYH02_001633 [Chlamydomonas schloesseri]